jgi:orotidine-5'-phosphate decarboxylase
VNFADNLISAIRDLGHPLCVGLDPHLDRIPAAFRQGSMCATDPETPKAVGRYFEEVIDRLEKRVAVVKPQIALFETMGWRGIQTLTGLLERCRQRNLRIILDAKRGDIGSTAAGYASAYLGADAALEVDALTVNPYLGRDSLAPFVDCCSANDRGLFVLVKTSNLGSADLQDQRVADGALYEVVAKMLAEDCRRLIGPVSGWSSLGVVVGATYPEHSEKVRAALPEALFLVPGFGAQGAGAKEAVRGFRRGPSGLEGGIVNSSRGILFPDTQSWEQGFEASLDAAIDQLGEAVR